MHQCCGGKGCGEKKEGKECCSNRRFVVVQVILLTLIVLGLGLLATQNLWVPKLVEYIITQEGK